MQQTMSSDSSREVELTNYIRTIVLEEVRLMFGHYTIKNHAVSL